jgi:hypothetical protein
MTEDLAQLAAELVAAFGPFTPFLVRAGERAAEEAAGRLGADAWEGAKRAWGRLRPAMDGDRRVSEAVLELSAAPDDPDLQGQLRYQLRRLLAQDDELASELASELARLLAGTQPPAGSVIGINVNGGISGGTNIGTVHIEGASRRPRDWDQ